MPISRALAMAGFEAGAERVELDTARFATRGTLVATTKHQRDSV